MSYSLGIIGLPNAGKSTLFNAMSRSSVPAEDFPFCTIDPNRGQVKVNDRRLRQLAEIVRPDSLVPLYLPIIDIAGLVKNAAKGEGLGNRFLAHIRETDALIHTVGCFGGDPSSTSKPAPNPIRDIEIVATELILSDIETVKRRWDKLKTARKSVKEDASGRATLELLERLTAHLDSGLSARCLRLTSEEEKFVRYDLNLLSAKPIMFIANVDEGDELSIINSPWKEKIEQYTYGQHLRQPPVVVAICARIEAEIVELPESDQALFLQELGWREMGLDRIVRRAGRMLNRLCFFTAGKKEVRAWSAAIGSDARTGAGKIHTDIARGFIAAEVVNFDDFIRCRGWKGARQNGVAILQGAQYLIADGDIVHFRFNV